MDLNERIAAVTAAIEAMPGAEASPMARGVTLYKVMGKMFAILEVNKAKGVIVKCEPALMDLIKSQYTGIGHRGHLDRRFWLHVDFTGDVPTQEVLRLITHSYEQVCAGLTKRQREALGV